MPAPPKFWIVAVCPVIGMVKVLICAAAEPIAWVCKSSVPPSRIMVEVTVPVVEPLRISLVPACTMPPVLMSSVAVADPPAAEALPKIRPPVPTTSVPVLVFPLLPTVSDPVAPPLI